MKRFHRRSRRLCILAALLVLLVLFLRQNVLLDTASRHAILLDAQSGRVLAQKRADERTAPASLTKMMTVLLVIETEPDLDKQVTLPEDIFPALQTENASMAGFVPDETVTVRDLLYGAMLPSGCLLYTSPAEDEARKAIRILNPISENLSIMRTLLTPSMLNVIVDNLKKGNAEGRLFEMAPVYLAKELPINEHPHERQTLCIGAFGPEEDFFTVKGALEALAAGFGLTFDYQRETAAWLHPGISAAVYCNGKRLGVFGKLANEINAELEIAKEQKDSQNIYLGEMDYEALMSCVEGELRYKPLSSYAPVKRDLALVCGAANNSAAVAAPSKKSPGCSGLQLLLISMPSPSIYMDCLLYTSRCV